jgi:predicted nucleotidyltransferase
MQPPLHLIRPRRPVGHVQIIRRMYDKSNMRFHAGLEDVFGNRIRVRILRALFRGERDGYTGRELAQKCRVSPSQAIRAAQSLEEVGIVAREIVGRAHVWKLATGHELALPLQKLFADEATSLERLNEELARRMNALPAERAWIFGSVARGDELPTSDVDVFIEVKTEADRRAVLDTMNRLSGDFAVRFGNPISTIVWRSGELRRPSNPRLVEEIARDGLPIGLGR